MKNTIKVKEAVKTRIYKSMYGEYAIRYYKNSPNTLVIKARGKLYEIVPGDRVRLRRTIYHITRFMVILMFTTLTSI